MFIIPTTSHPTWCDPRSCKAHLADDGDVSYEHRSAAAALTPAAHRDVEIAICTSQIDDRGDFPTLGAVNITLELRSAAHSATYGGPPLTFDVDLDPMDARMLAAQLVVAAEQREAAIRAERVTR